VVLDSAGHLLNDLAVTRAGDLYVTDSEAGALYHLAPGADRLERVLDGSAVFRANGIALAPDESRLFVAAWPGIVAVDPRSRTATPLRRPADVVTGGLDGLYFHEGSLVGVQNDVHPGRVMRYWLSPALDSVVRAEVLQAYHPLFQQPTTGAIAGDDFYLLANPQLGRRRPFNSHVPLEQLDPAVVVLRVALRSAGR
jgi:hypothetical protein